MTQAYIFKAKGYLEKSYLDKDGAKHATFEFTIKDAVEIAKLELMGRDLINHLPVLLDIEVRISDEQREEPKKEVRRRGKFKG